MARLNKQELEELHDLAMAEPGIHQLLINKENALEELAPNKNTEFQILTYAPTPLVRQWSQSVDRLQKEHAFERHVERENIQSDFDDRIENRARENVSIFGMEYQSQMFDQLNKDQIVALAEKGSDAVLKMDREKQYDIEKTPIPEKDTQIEKDNVHSIDTKMKLSLEETQALMNKQEFLTDRYEDNAKDMDLYREIPDPADDYE